MTPKKPTPSQIENAKQTLINAGFINPTNWQLIDIIEMQKYTALVACGAQKFWTPYSRLTSI